MALHHSNAMTGSPLRGAALVCALATLCFGQPDQVLQSDVEGEDPFFRDLHILPSVHVYNVRDVAQDSAGFLWFGSMAGLYRYDGYSTRLYVPDLEDPTSLSQLSITVLYVAADGTLWIGTKDGLNRFDRETDTFRQYRRDPNDASSLPDNRIGALLEDRSGRLWVGTFGGLAWLDRATGKFTHLRHDPSDPNSLSEDDVGALCEDRDGNLWFGTWSHGLDRYDPATSTFKHFRYDPDRRSSLSGDRVRKVLESKDGSIWIGTNKGVDRYDRASGAISHLDKLSGYSVDAMREDRSGALWISAWLPNKMPDLFRYDPDRAELYLHRPEENRPDGFGTGWGVLGISEDRTGMLWFGTRMGGVSRLDRHAVRFNTYSYDPDEQQTVSLRSIESIVELPQQPGVVWMGSQIGGLTRFDRLTGAIDRSPLGEIDPGASTSNWRQFLDGDREGTLWIEVRGGGLSRLDPETGTRVTYRYGDGKDPNTINGGGIEAVLEARDGTFWIGTDGGILNHLDPETGHFTHYRIDDESPIFAIHEADDGKLWLGSTGLVHFDPLTGAFTTYKTRHQYLTQVWVLHVDQEGRMWTGVYLAGLHLYNPDTGVLEPVLTEREGLPHNQIFGIQGDGDGNLWIVSATGLTRFDPGTGAIRNYGPADGLPDWRPLSLYRTARGEMLLGMQYGLVTFFPDQVKDNPYVPPVVLTGFKLFNEPVALGEDSPLKTEMAVAREITLRHDLNDFSIGFSALNYHYAEKNQYRYRLQPYEETWRNVGSLREAAYMNLDPGTYTFSVQGSNDDGLWNEEGRTIQITILPPWWETWWAYVLYALAAGVVLFTVHEARVRRLRTHAVELSREVENRTKDLVAEKAKTEEQARRLLELDEAKNRFFANISHEFRTPLTLIVGPLQDALDGVFGRSSKELAKQHRLMMRSARRLLRLVNQLLDLTKLQSGKMEVSLAPGDLVQYTRDVVRSFVPLAERKEISLDLETDLESLACEFDPDVLEKVLSNLLSNALKFTTAGDRVRVTIRSTPDASLARRPGEPLTRRPGELAVSQNDDYPGRHPRESLTRHPRELVSAKRDPDSSGEGEDGSGDPELQSGKATTVEIAVQDTGPGIKREDLDRIFARFEQVDASTRRPHEGTGIGLALAKELTELHGGELLVHSEPGRGSTFTVRLFVEESAPAGIFARLHGDGTVETDGLDELPLLDKRQGDGVFSGAAQEKELSILIVEDNADVREHLKRHLAPMYGILEAENGEAGLAAVQEYLPDLVLSDVMMPVMDGYEMCRLIKANEELRHIPVIMLTAKAGEQATMEGIGSGADAYLAKPFSIKELKVRIGALIASRRELREQFSREIVVKPADIVITPEDEVFLHQVQNVIDDHLGDTTFNVDWLADEVGMSRRQLERRVNAVVGEAPAALVRRLRLARASQLLRASAGTVSEIAYTVGFNSPAQFAKAFRKEYGAAPLEYVKGAATADQ